MVDAVDMSLKVFLRYNMNSILNMYVACIQHMCIPCIYTLFYLFLRFFEYLCAVFMVVAKLSRPLRCWTA